MRLFIYNLRTVNDRSILSIDLTGLVDPNNPDHSTIKINLPSGLTTLNKWDYMNKGVVYNDGKVFFIVCNKQASRDWAFEVLMKYAIKMVDDKIEKLSAAKEKYKRELVAA